jgi:hypothetical protein
MRLVVVGLVVGVSGCIVRVDDLPGWGDEPGETQLWFEPQYVDAGDTVVATITDDYGNTDFRDAYAVRAIGDFTIVEWQADEDQIDLVVEVRADADGDQPIAVDLPSRTAYGQFTAQ